MRISRKGALYSSGKKRRELIYLTQLTSLGWSKAGLGGTAVGDYALFAGGQYVDNAAAYTSALTRVSVSSLNHDKGGPGVATVGDYAIFAGGRISANAARDFTDAYSSSLTLKAISAIRKERYDIGATTVGDYAIFAGGEDNDGMMRYVDAYSSSLTRSNGTLLPVGVCHPAATTIGNYALIVGGDDDANGVDNVTAYHSSLTQTVVSSLSSKSTRPIAFTLGGRAICGESYTLPSVTDIYDENLTKTTIPNIIPRYAWYGYATIADEFAVMYDNSIKGFRVYNSALTLIKDLPAYKTVAAPMVTLGDYIIHAGGSSDATAYAYVLK